MGAEIVDDPSYGVLDLEWGLNLFNRRYVRFCIILPSTRHWNIPSLPLYTIRINTWSQELLNTSRTEASKWLKTQGGLIYPIYDTFSPSGSLVRHQIWFQTPHNGPTGQALLSKHHWRIFWTFGTLLGALKRPSCEQIKPFGPQTVPNLAFWPLKRSSDGPKWTCLCLKCQIMLKLGGQQR